MKYKRTQKRSKQMWQRVEKFSIRKFSFGAASCLIGAITVLGSSSQIANADGITSYEANGDKVTAYAHGESVYKLRGTSTSIYNAFRMDVDTSKYTKENPVITVTLTYNAPDNPNEKAPIFWSGRPFHWFTVPEGTEELGDDYKLTLTNGSGVTNEYTNWSSWESNSRFIHSKYNNNPDAWERHNTTTGEMLRKTPFVSLNSEFNKFLGDYNNRWYDNSNMPTQEIMHDLRAKSRSIYADWEKRAAGTVTVTYTTKVKDPVNTKELTIGMGVYQELNRQQYARVETVKLPVLYKLNELFEPKVPERTGVANPNQLTDDEVNAIKAKIWAANVNNENELLSTNKLFKDNLKDSSNNGANSISIDKATGDATITYKDDTTDTIKGSELVYEKPKASKDNTSSAEFKTELTQGIKYYIKPVPVKDYNGITSDDRNRALDSFLHENLNDTGYQNYKRGIQFYLISYFKREVELNVKGNSVQFEFDNNNNLIVKRSYDKRTLAVIPKEDLFLRPTFDVDAARTEAKKVIGSLDNLYPIEKTGFETEINQATEREGIERVLNEAQSKANENAVALAKMKKTANDKINALGYLTKEEKEEAIAKINTATIKQNDDVDKVSDANHPDTDANRDATKARLDSVVAELEKKNLEKAKEEAIKNINNISDENLPKAEKDKYIQQIKDATEVGPVTKDGTVLNLVKQAQEAASAKEADRKKAEADKVRQQYKDMINQIPGLTDEEKKQYNDAIDKATSTDEMDAIVDFAKLSGERKNAVAEIEKLEYLNNNQKQSFKDLVENSANKEEIKNYVSQAKQLNSKMKQLHDLVEKAKTIKPTAKYTSAADDKKDAFDKALTAAESVLNKENGADESISIVENLFKTLETAINELKPGSEKVKVDVDKSLLQEEYAKGETVKKSPLYKNSTDEGDKTGDDRRNEYNKKLEAAKTILADELAEQTDVDGALEELLSAKADLNGKETDADKAIPTVTNGTVAISVDPATTPRVTEKTDKDAIINAVTVPQGQPQPKSKEFANDGNIEDGTNENANKKVVKVKVTYDDGSSETIEVPVEGTDAAKSPLTPPAKVKVVNPNDLTEDEQKAVKQAVKDANPTLTDDQITVDKTGKVTVTYDDNSKNVLDPSKTVEAKTEEDGSSTSPDATANKTELEKAKEKAKSDLAQAAAKEKAEIDADEKLSEDEKAQAKAKVDEAKKAAESNIDKATTPEEVAKATEAGKKAIDAVHQITPEQAKSDLDAAANTEKGEIGGDTTLTDKEKEALKAKVDEVKKAAEDKINNAKTPEEIAKATEEGKKAIADVYNPQTAKGQSTSIFKPELDLQTALVSGKATVEKGKDLIDEEILKQLALADGLTAKVISKPTTTETGTKEAEVEVTLADGTKVTVKVPVEVVASLDTADKDNDLAKAKEDAKKQVEEAAKKKLEEIKNNKDLTEDQKQKAEKEINKAKEDANKAIDEASSAGTAKQIADQAKENIEKYNPKADTEVKKPDVTNLDEEKAKAKAEILEEAQKRIDEIKNNKDLSDEAKAKAIEEINKAKDKAIEDINKAQSKDEINAAKEAGIHKINEVQPDGSIASKFDPKVPENKVEVENPAKLSDEEREQVRQNIEGANTFPDGTTVEVKPDGTAVITYKDGSSDTISKDKLVAPANKETETIASRTEPVIPGKTQVGNTTKLTPEEQATVKKAVEEANNFPAGTTVEVRPDGTVVITYPDKSVDTIPGDKLVEKGSKQETPKVQTDAEKNPAQVPGNFVPVENTHNLTQTEQDTVAAKVKEANPAATDVKVSKDGTATLTYSDGSVNTIPGTSLVVAKDTDNEVATQAAQNPAVVPVTTEVGNAHSLTPEEQAAVTAKVQAANPAATDVKVSKDGTATLTYSDGSVNTIPGTSLVVQKEETSTQEQPTIAEKTKVIIPANPTKVAEATRLTDAEKEAVKKAVVDANGFGSDVKVEVAGDGTATIVFKDGSAITIPGNQLVAQDPKAQDSTKPTAEKSTVKAPAQRVDVKDITHLTDEEKEKVKVAILQANDSALDGATINVAGDGTATITFPDGSVVTILGKDTVQQSAKGESVTQEATPEYKPETTPGGDNGGNTGSSDANANAGGGSQAGGQAHTGSQTPAQSQASKQLATEKESAKNVIEKAAKDKQDEIKGSPLSDKEQAELLARVEAEKQAALKEIENAKTVEDVKEAETIGVQAIAMVTVPKRPVAPNAAPQATSAPQATAGTMQDVTYQSPARKQLPNTGSASSAALASLGLVAATSGFALLGRKARRRK